MTVEDQESEYVRLSREYWSIKAEMATVFAALRRLRDQLAANVKTLKEAPDLWNIDSDDLCEEIKRGAKNADRYRELLFLASDNQAALDKFKGLFPPVPES